MPTCYLGVQRIVTSLEIHPHATNFLNDLQITNFL